LIEPSRQQLSRSVRIALGVALAAYLGVAAWLVWRTSILEPYSDMFAWLARWRRLQADGDLGRYLWAPHNFHHLVWTFAVLDLDIRAFGGHGYLFLAVGALCLAATVAMLSIVAAAAAGRGLRLVGVGGAIALSAMGCHILDASAHINTTYVHALVFAVAAILLAEWPGGRPAVRGLGAIACAVAAGLGSAAGLAVWPALAFGAWRAGRRGWLLSVLATGASFSTLYLLGQSAPDAAYTSEHGVSHAADSAMLFVNYLGLPWVRGVPVVGWLLGVAVLVAGMAVAVFKGGAGKSWPERVAVQLAMFSLATAAMAGLARTGLIAPSLVPMRYAVFMIPLHVGVWILALPHVRRAWTKRPGPAEIAMVAGAALMLVHQTVMGVYAVGTGDSNLRLIADFRSGTRTPAMLVTIYTNLDAAKAISEGLRRDGLYQHELRAPPRS
jgi:hypothetical protein